MLLYFLIKKYKNNYQLLVIQIKADIAVADYNNLDSQKYANVRQGGYPDSVAPEINRYGAPMPRQHAPAPVEMGVRHASSMR